MAHPQRRFIILVSIVLGFGLAFWLRQLWYDTTNDIPETIIVATSADYPPFSFKQDDALIGFDIDVVTAAIKRLGKQMVLKDVPFELLIPQANTGTSHVIAANLSVTPERKKTILFTTPYLTTSPLVVLTHADMPALHSLENLDDARVAVATGHTADLFISKLPNIAVERLPNLTEMVDALLAKKVDALVLGSQAVTPLFEKHGTAAFNTFVINDTDENAALAVSKMYPRLTIALSEVLEQMQNDGTLDQLKQKWNVQ